MKRKLSNFAETVLSVIPFAPNDIGAWQIFPYDMESGDKIYAALQQLRKRGLIVVSPQKSAGGKRWQRPAITERKRGEE